MIAYKLHNRRGLIAGANAWRMILQKREPADSASHCCELVLVCLFLMVPLSSAQSGRTISSPAELVRKTVANELAAADAPGHYMYRMTKETPSCSQTRQMVETRDWLIGRLILIDGRPLPPWQEQKEAERLRKLLTNHSSLRALQKHEHQDEGRVRRMMRALPDAFIYDYAGSEKDECCGGQLARLKFRPNPAFRPSSREVCVYQGMEGTMLVDSGLGRIVRVEAQLIRDVKFGYGILGRLYRGGTFLLEQRDVGSGRWAITKLGLHFSGRILLFKSFRIDSVGTSTDFRRMPDNLTLEQGLATLLNLDESAIRDTTSPFRP
jgi:hypothetical protein